MNIFETVKASVPPSRAAEHFGLSVSRNGMVCCPFHIVGTSSISFALPQAAGLIHSTVPPLPTKSSILREPLSHPSMKLYDDHFHCFGCQATGAVIEFTSKLFGITALEAAQKLAADFGIREARPSVLAKLKTYQTQAENEKLCFRVLREYLLILQDWKKKYAPKTPEEEPHERFVEACQMLECTQFMVDLLTEGPARERETLVADLMTDDKIHRLREQIKTIKEESNEQA